MSANRVFTMVVRWPEDQNECEKVQAALNVLEPYKTAMSIEDEMSILEFIEQHPDFDESIADEARDKAKALHSFPKSNLALTN